MLLPATTGLNELTDKSETIRKLELVDNALAAKLFGKAGESIKRFEKRLGVRIDTRGSSVTIAGAEDKVLFAERVIGEVYALLDNGYPFAVPDIVYAINVLRGSEQSSLTDVFMDTVFTTSRKKRIAPKTLTQKQYLGIIRAFDIAFGIGPAGTGKTYLAIAAAAAALTEKKVDRIILTRPAVEAGEKLGFLPGDLAAKIDPYLRPLYDALHDMIDPDQVQNLMERGTIEVAPLAFMRGRTLNNSFVILDEAQNTTVEQMKMFLTRLGFGSKAVVTGDITQIDLPEGRASGLVESQRILKGVEGISFVNFNHTDVVRHPLVQEVIRAFERDDANGAKKEKGI